MGAWPDAERSGRARFLGGGGVPQSRRPVAGAALLERLSVARQPIVWHTATVRELVAETSHARTIVLDVADWPGHIAGQHVDLRLTAEDGYQTQRSYSLASAPEDPHAALPPTRRSERVTPARPTPPPPPPPAPPRPPRRPRPPGAGGARSPPPPAPRGRGDVGI